MRNLIIILIILTILFSCNRQRERDKFHQYYRSEVILKASIIMDSLHYEINKGNKTVFILSYCIGDSSKADGRSTESLIFEIDSLDSEFTIKDKEFDNYSGIYYKSCFCFDGWSNRPTKVKRGKVYGKRITSKTWIISVNTGMIVFNDTIQANTTNIINLKKKRLHN